MIHVITPFSRPENAAALLRHLDTQGVAVTWHPLVSSVPLPAGCEREWVKPLSVNVPGGADPFCYKLRAFVESGRIRDGERYCVLNDDDLYDDGVLAAVDAMPERIVIVSMLRGQRTPAYVANGHYHPTGPLMARPDLMHVGGIGVEQYFVMGEIFRHADFPLDRANVCDGLVAEWLAATYPDDIRYEPELYVLFNRLEPGRWAVDYEDTRLYAA